MEEIKIEPITELYEPEKPFNFDEYYKAKSNERFEKIKDELIYENVSNKAPNYKGYKLYSFQSILKSPYAIGKQFNIVLIKTNGDYIHPEFKPIYYGKLKNEIKIKLSSNSSHGTGFDPTIIKIHKDDIDKIFIKEV